MIKDNTIKKINTVKASAFVSIWESVTELPKEQQKLLERLVDVSSTNATTLSISKPKDNNLKKKDIQQIDDMLPLERIENIQQFYEWFVTLETYGKNEENERYLEYRDHIKSYLDQTVQLMTSMKASLDNLDELNRLYQMVADMSNALSNAAESMVVDLNYLEAYADNITDKLSYFNQLELISAKFHSTNLSVTDEDFLTYLHKLDDCIVFIKKNRHFKEATDYYLKFKQLQNRGLTLLKNYIVKELRAATKAVQEKILSKENETNSAYYVIFKTVAPSIKCYIEEMEQRATNVDYKALLSDCHYCLCKQRSKLLSPVVAASLNNLATLEDISQILREGASYIIYICHMEYDLYQHFFSTLSPELRNFLDSFAVYLYDILRPMIIRHHDIDILCSLTDIIKTEIVAEQLGARGETVQFLIGVFERLLEDIQERLLFLAQIYFRDNIQKYVPDEHALDFPNRLLKLRKRTRKISNKGKEHVDIVKEEEDNMVEYLDITDDKKHKIVTDESEAEEADKKIKKEQEDKKEEEEEKEQEDKKKEEEEKKGKEKEEEEEEEEPTLEGIYSTWYPTLERTLMRLAMLYLSVDTVIFEGLAHEAVAVCTQSLIAASKLIDKKQNSLHSQLFLIRHLLILRAQISPFEIEFSITESSLDFSAFGGALKRIISGERSFFTFGKNNAFFDVVSDASPRVHNSNIDSKKDLENLLIVSVDSFVSGLTRRLIASLMSLITDIKSASILADAKKKESDGDIDNIKENSNINPITVKEILLDTETTLTEQLPELLDTIDLYLHNESNNVDVISLFKNALLQHIDDLKNLLATHGYPTEVFLALNPITKTIEHHFEIYNNEDKDEDNEDNDDKDEDKVDNDDKDEDKDDDNEDNDK